MQAHCAFMIVFCWALLGSVAAQTPESEAAKIQAAFANETIDIELDSVPLVQAVYRILAQVSTPVTIRWPEQMETKRQGIILPRVEGQPIGDVLRQVLLLEELDYTIQGGELIIAAAKDRICIERDVAETEFIARGLRVDMVVAKSDRCASRAMVMGVLRREGEAIDPDTLVGLIQIDRVIFQFKGFLFEIKTPGGATNAAPDEPTRDVVIEGDATPEDIEAFDLLGLKVSGTVYNADDSRASFALVNGNELYLGNEIKGAVVESITGNSVGFRFRGQIFKIYIGE